MYSLLNSRKFKACLHWLKGFSVVFASGACGVFGLSLCVYGLEGGREIWLAIIGLIVIGLAYGVASVGLIFLDEAHRLYAPRGTQVLKDDGRPPIVFLRSFEYDQRDPIHEGTGGKLVWRRHEELINRIFTQCGPVIAVQNPDVKLPPLGVPRIIMQGDSWLLEIMELVQRAQLVILSTGDTPGVRQEFSLIMSLVPPEKLLLRFTPGRDYQLDAEYFWRLIPAHPPSELSRYESPQNLYVYFDTNWTPHIVNFGDIHLLFSREQQMMSALMPVLSRLGLEHRRRRPGFIIFAYLIIATILLIFLLPLP